MARRIGLAANTEPLVVGEWTRATSAPADTSERSLFDSMMMPDTKTTRLPTTVRPTTPSTETLVTTTTTTSLFDSTEIFYENFTKPDAGSVIVSEDFKPLLEAINRNSSPLKSKFPAIPDKFMDVIKNHTNTLKSLFSDGSSTTTTTLPSTTITTTLPERSLFSASSQSDSNESMFSVSRPSGKIDESLIVPALRRQTRLDVSLEKNSRFGLSRPMIRGVITESDRSSDPPEKTVKYFKNHKYSFLTHSRDEKDLTIEEILEVSRTKKDFEVSQRFKPKYPVYIKKNVAHSISGRNAREQEIKIKRLLATNLPFATGRIFDSGTGKVEDLDLDKSRTLFPEARDNDDDGDEENENDNLEELNDADENEDENDEDLELEDELESNIVIETDDGYDEGSGDVGLGSSYIERQLNDADEHQEQYDHEKEETKNYEDENDEENDEDGKDVEEEYEEEDEEEDEDGDDEDERDGENNDEVDDEDEDEADADYEDDHEEDGEYEEAGEGENEEEIKNGDSISEHDEEKERSLNFNERSNQNGQESTRNSHQNILFPGPLHYRLVPRYPLPVPHQYYQPVHYQLVPRPYAYINRGQHFYSAFI